MRPTCSIRSRPRAIANIPAINYLAINSSRRFSYTRCLAAVGSRRVNLSNIWTPEKIKDTSSDADTKPGHNSLIRAGFLRQSQSGIFHMFPLGSRVQQKLENLLDKHMQSLGASRVKLSSLTSEALWRKSGRLDKVAPELFRVQDRKGVPLMLAPTHEEEITTMVAETLQSYKQLPLRLYQSTPKYRDEIRPRHGLLRSREFLMKDLYTYDTSYDNALGTYREVRQAYKAFFDDLKLPIIAAEASSGDMGGDLSHEYHLANPIGSDIVFKCDTCDYAANDEVAKSRPTERLPVDNDIASKTVLWRGISKDRKTLVNAWLYKKTEETTAKDVNIHAIKSVIPDLDTSIDGDARSFWDEELEKAHEEGTPHFQLINIVDSSLGPHIDQLSKLTGFAPEKFSSLSEQKNITLTDSSLERLSSGAGCPKCETGSLQADKALELGHTFYLGTRYTKPLGVTFNPKPRAGEKATPIHAEMGCYGIGISRLFAAVAEHMVDEKGLNWPRAIAPFEVAVIPIREKYSDMPESYAIYDLLAADHPEGKLDVVFDDRQLPPAHKLNSADLIGYPVLVVLGNKWLEEGICEIQCRRLGVKENVSQDAVPAFVRGLLDRL